MIVAFDLDDTLFSEFDFCRSAYALIAEECHERYGTDDEVIFNAMMNALLSRSNPFDALEDIIKTHNPSIADPTKQSNVDLTNRSLLDHINPPIAELPNQSIYANPRNAIDGHAKRAIDEPSTQVREDFDIKEWVEIYRTHKPDYLPLAEDADKVLAELSKSDIKLAVITDGRTGTQTAKFNALGLGKYIDRENLIISQSTGFDKTCDHNFKLLMKRNPEEKEFIYIADNQAKDFYFPNLLGWHTICVKPSFPTVHPFILPDDKGYSASSIIIGLKDLLKDKKIAPRLIPPRL